MNAPLTRPTFFLAPVSHEAGLTSMALGLVRALQLSGVKVGFLKPIVQPEAIVGDIDLASHFAETLCGVSAPEPIAFDYAADRVRAGRLSDLMEEIVALAETVRGECDALVVEGLIPDAENQVALRLNSELIRSLGADLVPVMAGRARSHDKLAAKTASAIEHYGENGRRPVAGVLINHCSPETAAALKARPWLEVEGVRVPVIAAAQNEPRLNAPRLIDVAAGLELEILHRGDIERARVEVPLVAARACEQLISHLRPGTLVITPAERSDALLATALVAQRGMPLAGLLFTCGGRPAREVQALFAQPPLNRLPQLATPDDTFTLAAKLADLSRHVGRDDAERMERVIAFVAERIDVQPLLSRFHAPQSSLMPPPVFRHRVVAAARSVDQRIVLPEGDEPRTLKAAAICAEKGIARCVLIGKPETVRAVASAHGVDLPTSVEVLDPETARGRLVAPMVELRKAKGLTAVQAEKALEDNVVLGTMMLATGEVDGLVSGAVHTTASTVRPALQLIKTAPGSSIVSSVFFMLMPDQVLVYGDCAINPDPSAEELAEIAIQSAESAAAFGIVPRVAMISYSTGSSGSGADVEKVREATRRVRERRPDLAIDGPMQYDAASVESVGRQKAPGSPVAGQANVFVFPDLNTGNTTYKAVQRSANVVSVGPMLQGLRKPVNDLSRGALVDDIVYTIALTAIQAAAGEAKTERADLVLAAAE